MKPIIVVSTFQRGGSSLVMQMLAAAGVDCVGSAPDFEDPRTLSGPGIRDLIDALPRDRAHAVKVLEPQRLRIPNPQSGPVRTLWLDRDPRQRARSAIKFSKWTGLPVDDTRRGRRALEASYRRDRVPALTRLQSLRGALRTITFEGLINQPYRGARLICDLADLTPNDATLAAMVRVIHPRPASCLDGMLEEALLKEAAHG